MDRKEALELLKLSDAADRNAITLRYNVLFKKYAEAKADENGVPLASYDEAYNLLMGIEYRDLRAEAERKRRQEKPNPILKALRIDPEKASHLIYYYKWHAIAVIVAVAMVGSLIWSIATHVDPDLKIMLVGSVATTDSERLSAEIKAAVPGTVDVQVQMITLGEGVDGQTEVAMQQKLMVEFAAGNNDVVLIDADLFERYANQGMFKPLDELLAGYGTTAEEQAAQRVDMIDENNEPTGETAIYGLDVTDSTWLKEHDVFGTKIIAALVVNGEFDMNADTFLDVIDFD